MEKIREPDRCIAVGEYFRQGKDHMKYSLSGMFE